MDILITCIIAVIAFVVLWFLIDLIPTDWLAQNTQLPLPKREAP